MYKNQAERTAAKVAAAAQSKTSVRSVNRLGICDKPLESVQNRAEKAENAQKHRENCAKHVELVKSGKMKAKHAAIHCGITLRQMYRHIAAAEAKDVQ